MDTETLRVGAGRAEINLPAELFPTEGFIGVHDSLHVRVLLMESKIKLAFVSIELTSLPAEIVTALQSSMSEVAGVPPENVLICVTHTFSAPHFLPGHLLKDPADQNKNEILLQAVKAAMNRATTQAISQMTDARFGCETGTCNVNVNRDVLTAEGWWLGSNETGPSDKAVTVLRFETLDGHPIAILFSYSVQPSVMDGSQLTKGGRLVSTDMAGSASRFVEQAYEDSVTALFCIGATGDQAPALKAKYQYVSKDGNIQVGDIHEQGFIIAEMLGKRLGVEVLHIAERSNCRVGKEPISIERERVRCPGQKLIDMKLIHPTKQHSFVPAEAREEPVEIVRIGEVILIGVRPELNCVTAEAIKKRSPFQKTVVLTMVNGGAKYMPDSESYDRITYEAMNSPFGRGSAELLCKKIVKRLRSLR